MSRPPTNVFLERWLTIALIRYLLGRRRQWKLTFRFSPAAVNRTVLQPVEFLGGTADHSGGKTAWPIGFNAGDGTANRTNGSGEGILTDCIFTGRNGGIGEVPFHPSRTF